ncbi:hypothetical protein AWM75_01400 [Aerococcus urinaehominis]|uniref:Uncharacterized protein n=1 Tax=Aerococcus urinaehominis TaxID=128944 RepID=A0A0X8FK14_9LACT|nr:glutathione S-transferase C-terminal domain-containing protein [Aerococcus urinaehominis]AMB98732.1 hypothetical protein AWM75_01400 [Aerococcus urinaehominis]SDM00513.1 putative glutathione S-transferase [Aerococcus urinaehominis]
MSKVYEKDYDYEVAANKYHLIVARSCPFAQRTDIARSLLGLEDAISKSVVDPIKTEKIWEFKRYEGAKDPVLGVEYVSDVYHNTNPAYDGPYSVPVLADIETGQVVNQESLDIVKDFVTRFQALHTGDAPNLYNEDDREAIDAWVVRISSDIMSAPYKAHGAEDQATYDEQVDIFFTALADIDKALSQHDYLVGNQLTLADIVLYTPLLRFDTVFYPAFQVNQYRLEDFPNLWAYLKKLYHIPAFNQSTDWDEIKEGTYLGKNGRNHFGKEILPAGPQLDQWED